MNGALAGAVVSSAPIADPRSMPVMDPAVPLSSPFDWQDLPSGRARFAGLVRGADQAGHDAFAVCFDGQELFGEIQRAFLANDNDFNIEVVAFGYRLDRNLGMPMPGTAQVFAFSDVERLQRLISELVAAGAAWERRPRLLVDYPSGRFQGRVLFREGWILISDDEVVS
ncbi:hypothetical protein [Stenotrophomonas maltophilia]|uniref:hypothetical protein n=1 Tax=Stenotrophomonas maltophilia TaxID=40324 RepID=UPI0013DA3B93|nr:hypothetical protein [Stenotrophomonas maltophilia]